VAYAADGIPVESLAIGFRIIDAGVARVAEDSWEAAHWVLNAAIAAHAEAVEGAAVLNAGAATVDAGALVFAGESHAGKSAIALHLAAIGRTLLGDDRLLVATLGGPPTATALGLARKVRTPLPEDFSPAARRLAAVCRAGHAGGADVLAWDARVDVPAGFTAPIGRILVVRRDPTVPAARLVALGSAEAVATLLTLCGRHAGTAADLLAAMARLAKAVPVHRLEAPTAAAAADCLNALDAAGPA